MAEVGIKELLEAGVHFGHQTRRWNPKMRRFIFGERGGIYIIDLLKTQSLLEQAQNFATEIAHRGGTVLFVGTKKQARDGIKEIASAAGMPYVNHRWLGGLLTNYQTMSLRIRRLHDLERYATEGQLALLPTRERLSAEADLLKLQANLGGVKDMQRVPDAMFVIDLKTEAIAVREAQRLRIPIIGLVDTNCDPDGIDYVIPGNDDAIRACNLITHAIGDVVQQGRQRFRTEEEQARREAEEQQRREQEERARREAEERAAAEAAERAAAEEALTAGGRGPAARRRRGPGGRGGPGASGRRGHARRRGGRRRAGGRRAGRARRGQPRAEPRRADRGPAGHRDGHAGRHRRGRAGRRGRRAGTPARPARARRPRRRPRRSRARAPWPRRPSRSRGARPGRAAARGGRAGHAGGRGAASVRPQEPTRRPRPR